MVDGYCRLVNDNDISIWDRSIPVSLKQTPSSSATNSLEKSYSKHETLPKSNDSSSENLINKSEKNSSPEPQHTPVTPTPQNSCGDFQTPILNEDYAELGLEEEGDYSTPAARNYELDRSQISLDDIIGVGQFGDVHIGTCRIKQLPLKKTHAAGLEDDDDTSSMSSLDNNNDNKTGVIHVAVKTCKADADLATAEKFLEEAC